jgi:hypothetical protein
MAHPACARTTAVSAPALHRGSIARAVGHAEQSATSCRRPQQARSRRNFEAAWQLYALRSTARAFVELPRRGRGGRNMNQLRSFHAFNAPAPRLTLVIARPCPCLFRRVPYRWYREHSHPGHVEQHYLRLVTG